MKQFEIKKLKKKLKAKKVHIKILSKKVLISFFSIESYKTKLIYTRISVFFSRCSPH